ncbi:MAG: hypothetical protein R2932_06375 [Caldilineaceae bacterium]
MASPRGMLTVEQLTELASVDLVDTILVMFTDHYGRFMGKRYDATFFLQACGRRGHSRL